MNSSPLLHIDNISIKIDDNIIVEDFSLELFEKDKIVITAASGCGKTSILNTVLGFTPIFKGNILFSDTEFSSNSIDIFRNNIAWLPQMFDTDIIVSDFIKTPFHYKANRHLKYNVDKIHELYKEFDLNRSIDKKKINEISGGEKQRIGLITALLLERRILILDEPVSAIDSKLKNKIINYLFKKKEFTILSSSHDEAWLKNCNKVIEI